ncbi:hypothetical protein Y032_0018g3706 [Ancylostoma ceylanicum]|uniref:Reverse transcriptase domain-containing protein n=1 Tax=Ancylostoma ceylanicum TaxID=53326 RepID=A0A016V533_9BILA|nr:hypothetical protein Y032_0018g3706 [Ancylostoma ceylanicum]
MEVKALEVCSVTDIVLQQNRRREKDSSGLAEEHHNPDLEEERQPRGLCELSADTSAVSQHEDIRTHYRPSPRHHQSCDESVWFCSQLRDDGCDPCGMPADRKTQKPLHMTFLDLEKAFDRVPHEAIWYALRWHGVPEELIEWVRILYTDPRSRVQAAAGTSAEFPISVDVHQGSAPSPLLFILVMDAITRDLQRPAPWTLLYAETSCWRQNKKRTFSGRRRLGANVYPGSVFG